MSSSMDAVRVSLSSLRSALEQSGPQGRDALFQGREYLRDATQMLDSDQGGHLRPLAETLRFFMEQLLRGDGLSGEAATQGLLLLTDALAELTRQVPEPKRNSLALNYLMGSEGASPAAQRESAVRAGPGRTQPSLDAAKVGRLLSGYDSANQSSLGQILLHYGAINATDLDQALSLQKMSSRKLGEVLIAMELMGIETLNSALERQRMESSSRPTGPVLARATERPIPGHELGR